MEIKFDRVKALKIAYNTNKLPKDELVKIILDYYLCEAITLEQKEELLSYVQPKSVFTKIANSIHITK